MTITWKTYAFAAAGSVALIAAGLVHGFWTDRWSRAPETAAAAARLSTLPLDLGDWQGEEVEVKASEVAPGVAGCLQRRYTDARRGVTVLVALVCGRPGPVATHTPEVCYGASGYMVGDKRAVTVEGAPGAQFWTSDAVRSRVADETKLRIYWAWNDGQGWKASRDARIEFPRHRHPVLHKLYVLRDIGGPGEAPGAGGKDEPCEAFLQVLLPALQEKLFAAGP
jgi:hypothetical protein